MALTVLVVEDDTDLRGILRDNLNGHLDGPVGFAEGDIDLDADVDLDDFGQFKEIYPAVVAAAMAVPEPSCVALSLCALASLTMAVRRGRYSRRVAWHRGAYCPECSEVVRGTLL